MRVLRAWFHVAVGCLATVLATPGTAFGSSASAIPMAGALNTIDTTLRKQVLPILGIVGVGMFAWRWWLTSKNGEAFGNSMVWFVVVFGGVIGFADAFMRGIGVSSAVLP